MPSFSPIHLDIFRAKGAYFMDDDGCGCFLIIAVLIAILCFFAYLKSQSQQTDEPRFETFQAHYTKSGLFDPHPLEPLGPEEVTGSEFHGRYFSFLLIGGGTVNGQTTQTLNLRFKWQDPSGAYKVKDYPYENINFRVDEKYETPQIKLIFDRDTLSQNLDLSTDLTVYDYNIFFNRVAAVDIYLNQATYDSEMAKLKLP